VLIATEFGGLDDFLFLGIFVSSIKYS